MREQRREQGQEQMREQRREQGQEQMREQRQNKGRTKAEQRQNKGRTKAEQRQNKGRNKDVNKEWNEDAVREGVLLLGKKAAISITWGFPAANIRF